MTAKTKPNQTNTQPSDPPAPNMVWIKGGPFTMGSNEHYPEEAPTHRVSVTGYWIDKTPVTNRDFQRFIDATGYITVAERTPDPKLYPGAPPHMLVAGSILFRKPKGRVDMNNYLNWWEFVPGITWQTPRGLDSSIRKLRKHPAVHIGYEDAEAYAAWAGKALPTEAQWEFAARGGLADAIYTWGNEFAPNGKMMANTWQGEFPRQNLLTDGFEWTSPVGSFAPNGYGLYDMAGNVWEWTSDWYRPKHPQEAIKSCCVPENPRGAEARESVDPNKSGPPIPRKVTKGGSYLCAPNYCLRYRPAARSPEAVDTSTCHIGFRCVVNP